MRFRFGAERPRVVDEGVRLREEDVAAVAEHDGRMGRHRGHFLLDEIDRLGVAPPFSLQQGLEIRDQKGRSALALRDCVPRLTTRRRRDSFQRNGRVFGDMGLLSLVNPLALLIQQR